jgi:2-keto-4-pentenoate hydratase
MGAGREGVNADAFVTELQAARREGRPPRASAPAGSDREDGLMLQLAVLDRFVREGSELGGWKAGLSTGRSRDALGEGFRPFGYVLGDRVFADGARTRLGAIHDCRIEPELCVILGQPLKGAEVTEEEAFAAIGAIAPAFEINEVRVGMTADPALFLADGLANWGIVVGRGRPRPATPEGFCARVTLLRDGAVIAESPPDLAMDGPALALARMCRLMARFGLGLEAGQHVITGAYAQDRVTNPASYQADFAGIGRVTFAFD